MSKTIKLSDRVLRIKPSPTLAVSNRAEALIAAGKSIINLSLGEPDFDTPAHIKEAAIAAIGAGLTKYTAVDGTSDLKQAIINKFARENQLHYQPNQVIVSSGAKHSLFNLFMSVLNPQDEVIIPSPYWVSYPDMVKLADGTPIIVETTAATRFKITPAQLANAITPKTRLVIFNSPCNPTGMAYTQTELQALGTVLLQHPHILIASDDIYEHTLWQVEFKNILNACPALYDRTIIVNGVSKAYAMTGWRIGYAGGPSEIIAAMKKVQSQSTSNPTSISQAAAIAALDGDQKCTQEMTVAYKERHDFLASALEAMPGFKCLRADGTFYLFPDISALLTSQTDLHTDVDFAEFLLNVAEVHICM